MEIEITEPRLQFTEHNFILRASRNWNTLPDYMRTNKSLNSLNKSASAVQDHGLQYSLNPLYFGRRKKWGGGDFFLGGDVIFFWGGDFFGGDYFWGVGIFFTVQYCTVQYSTIQYSKVQYSSRSRMYSSFSFSTWTGHLCSAPSWRYERRGRGRGRGGGGGRGRTKVHLKTHGSTSGDRG